MNMAELIINTNEVVINEGTKNSDIKVAKTVDESMEIEQFISNSKYAKMIEDINRKLDILIEEKEVEDGKADH
ncbi:hypothetical protein HMPREF1577_01035 [Gardnerella pickettii JCP8017A]|uniref:Uncharacterized protein n=3 Tax=Bifidobacteriaceae TaxID=31953 RepID=T2PJX0_9BIFI|nr:hypothetical protein HMPREF1577_01035 [Gardnerella pickettii JCP8017A]EPI59172.1 hypothetical protein HMPREF1578_01360 [Gardnerella pickettii JCP8017B]KXI16089.1 hypothetical protein HMPREF3230_01226 [Gardnerella vaginalis]